MRFAASAMSFSARARYFARESLNAASALEVSWAFAALRSIGDAFGLSAMNFSSASTRFSGFFSPAAALNALASAGSSCLRNSRAARTAS